MVDQDFLPQSQEKSTSNVPGLVAKGGQEKKSSTD